MSIIKSVTSTTKNEKDDDDSLRSNRDKDDAPRSYTSRNMTELGERNFTRMTLGTTHGISSNTTEDPEQVQQLRAHLEQSQPFNKKWMIKEFLSSGAYGSVIAVEEMREDGSFQDAVLKVSKGESANKQAEWEALILERIQKENPDASVVRLLDSGTLANYDDDHLKFLAIERCEYSINQYLKGKTGADRQECVCSVALSFLKGLYDIHSMGILHRDVKGMNAGLIDDKDGLMKVLLFDFGNARLFTDDEGNILPPRTTTNYCGSREFSSSWADDMRDQTRWDDLFSWFYTAIDLMNPIEGEGDCPLPWTFSNRIQHKRATIFLKGSFMPAKITLRHCPLPFYAIHSYLHTAPRHSTPDYAWLAKKMREAKTYGHENTMANTTG